MLSETPNDVETSVKVGPEIGPNADALTALTRGRGPRRGNLEDLLKYWRPIMKKPGGFRRCVVILMDKPQFGGRPQRICAWLHHELTGKWPNEGNHHGRGKGKGKRKRRGKLTRRVRSAARKAKSANYTQNDYAGSALRQAISESRSSGGILTQPIAGRQNVVEMKAALFVHYSTMSTNDVMEDEVKSLEADMQIKRVGAFGSNSRFGQAAQAAGSTALPGNISPFRSPRSAARSAIYRTLTPGGGSGRGRRLTSAAGRLAGRTGRGARNRFRCPPGFVNGGTFTDRRFSTCGALVLRIPGSGPGSLSAAVQRSLARLARQAVQAQNIGDRRNRGAVPSSQIISNAAIPSTPKAVSTTRLEQSTNLVLNAIGADPNLDRVVKRDGVILEPLDLRFFANQTADFDDVVDSNLVVGLATADLRGQKAVGAAQTLNAGGRGVYLAMPDVGILKFSRVGGELSPADRSSLNRALPTSISRAADLPDPSAGWRSFVDRSGGKFSLEFGNLDTDGKFKVDKRDNELVQVVGPGQKKQTVPMWVYETFLSRSAPRRAKNDPIFELVPEGKSANPFFGTAKAGQHDTLYSQYQTDVAVKVGAYKDWAYLGELNFKRVRPGGVPLRRALGGFAAALAFFDPTISRYRCPPGFTGGGQLTNVRGTTCGRSLRSSTMQILGNLQDARGKFYRDRDSDPFLSERLGGVAVDDIEEGSFRDTVVQTQTALDEIIETFDVLSKRLPPVDTLDTLSTVNMPPLTDDLRSALDDLGKRLGDTLQAVQFSGNDVLDQPSWEGLASRLQDIATVEAQRQAYLEFYGLGSLGYRGDRVDMEIEEFASRLVGIANNQRVSTRLDEVTEEGVMAVSVRQRAEQRIQALITIHERGDLWDVGSLADYTELLDQMPFPDTDEQRATFHNAAVEQVLKYDDKVSDAPDSLSMEEYSYLVSAINSLIDYQLNPEELDKLEASYRKISGIANDKRDRELGQLDRPSDERTEDALAYLVETTFGTEYTENVENYAARLVERAYSQFKAEGGGLYDLFSKNVTMDDGIQALMERLINEEYFRASVDTDELAGLVFRWASAVGVDVSDEDKVAIERVLKETALHVKRSLYVQRISVQTTSTATDLDVLYSKLLDADRDVDKLVAGMPLMDFERYVGSLQQYIDTLYGIDGQQENLAALVAFKTEMRDSRARIVRDIAGNLTLMTNDSRLLPGPDGIPVWQAANRARQKGAQERLVRAGLAGLTPEDYDVALPGETPRDTLNRLRREGRLEDWAMKALLAADPDEAKRDRSKRIIIARFGAKTDDEKQLRVEIDNVFDRLLDYGAIDELALSSYFYVTIYDEDGNELTRAKVSSSGIPNVTRRLEFDSSGSYVVEHNYVIVNDRGADPQAPYKVRLPDGSTLRLDNRRNGISNIVNPRFIAMTYAAGFKENQKLDLGWDGKYVWPKQGVRSDSTAKIQALTAAFGNIVKNYDDAKASIDRGERLSDVQIAALLIFNGDDSKRDRVVSLLNYNNLTLTDSKIQDWAQFPEFIQALKPERNSKHEVHVSAFFTNGYMPRPSGGDADLIDQINNLIPANSSRVSSPSEILNLDNYFDQSVLTTYSHTMDSGVIDLSLVDLNEMGC